MLEKKDIQNIKIGDGGSITILEGINVRVQMFYGLCFRAVIVKKDDTFYYVENTSCKDGYEITEIPYKHITLGLLEEMEEKAVNDWIEKKGICVINPIEKLLRSSDAKTKIIYFDK